MALFGSMVYAEIKIKSLSWIQSNQHCTKGHLNTEIQSYRGKSLSRHRQEDWLELSWCTQKLWSIKTTRRFQKWVKLLLYKCKDWRLDPWSVLKCWADVVSSETLGRCSEPSLSQYLLWSVLEEHIQYQHLASTHLHTYTHTHENKHTYPLSPRDRNPKATGSKKKFFAQVVGGSSSVKTSISRISLQGYKPLVAKPSAEGSLSLQLFRVGHFRAG